jgi:hypothetical protein
MDNRDNSGSGTIWGQLPASAWPKFSRCNGATPGSAGDFERATDPWVSFGPDRRALVRPSSALDSLPRGR